MKYANTQTIHQSEVSQYCFEHSPSSRQQHLKIQICQKPKSFHLLVGVRKTDASTGDDRAPGIQEWAQMMPDGHGHCTFRGAASTGSPMLSIMQRKNCVSGSRGDLHLGV